VGTLIEALGVQPALVAGHSAGAAILCRACIDGRITRGQCSVSTAPAAAAPNAEGAVCTGGAAAGSTSLSSRLFVWSARDRARERLLASSGSSIDAAGVDQYWASHAAISCRGRAADDGQWILTTRARTCPGCNRADADVGGNDRMVRPRSRKVQQLLPVRAGDAAGLGHLAHEERPDSGERVHVGFASAWGQHERAHAIVIGSGFGGLAARATGRALSVTVLERLDAPGVGPMYFTRTASPSMRADHVTAPALFESLWSLWGGGSRTM